MTINIIDAARDWDPSAPPIGDEQTLLLLLASQGDGNMRTRMLEEEVIDAEDFWTIAEEANAIDPIG